MSLYVVISCYMSLYVSICLYMSCMFVCWDFIHTLEIIARILSEVVKRERLCSTNALTSVASAIFGAVRPLEEVPTQSSFVCSLDSKMV